MDKRGTLIIDIGEGPAPTDGAFMAANSVAEGIPSNRQSMHEYVQEMARRNPEVQGHPSTAWIDTFVMDSDIVDQNQTQVPVEERLTLSNLKLVLHQDREAQNERLAKAEAAV